MKVVLCGPMGAGKSSVARELAGIMSAPMIDVDHAIERETGKTIPQIFDQDGEPYFRQLESRIAVDAIDRTPRAVIALGGGALESEDVWERCLAQDVHLVYLRVSRNEALRRIRRDGPSRPLLRSANPGDRWQEILDRRVARFENADQTIQTDGASARFIAEQIAHDLS